MSDDDRYTEQEVRELYAAALFVTERFGDEWMLDDAKLPKEISDDVQKRLGDARMFFQACEEYMDARSAIDPYFNAPYTVGSCDAVDIYDWEWVTFQWSESGRCGDHDYYQCEFDIEDLWDPSWVERAEAAKKRKEEEARKKREAEAKAREDRERAQCRSLMKKYPDEAQKFVSGAWSSPRGETTIR